MKIKITGGNRLQGTVRLSGNKNSALPCIAAAVLTVEPVTLSNIPDISDVEVMCAIIKEIGGEAKRDEDKLVIQVKELTSTKIPTELSSKLRASVLFAGAVLARAKEVQFAHPGGDVIGKRTIEPHLRGFEKLGYRVEENNLSYKISSNGETLGDVSIFLEEAGVTATENLLLASASRDGVTTIKNCACEPHIVDLCKLLELMGARIEGIGTHTLIVFGKSKLGGAEYTIGSDFIEFGTYAVVAAITKGEVIMENCPDYDLDPVVVPMERMGLKFESVGEGKVRASASEIRSIDKLHTNIWPGFPPDLVSIMVVLATQAKGVSLIHDWMYESRFFFVDKLISMGAHITIADPHRVLVYGPTKLFAKDQESPDIRAGMALVLAALIAEGESVISNSQLISRGYADIVSKLKNLGANISQSV